MPSERGFETGGGGGGFFANPSTLAPIFWWVCISVLSSQLWRTYFFKSEFVVLFVFFFTRNIDSELVSGHVVHAILFNKVLRPITISCLIAGTVHN